MFLRGTDNSDIYQPFTLSKLNDIGKNLICKFPIKMSKRGCCNDLGEFAKMFA